MTHTASKIQRISVKLFFEQPQALNISDFIAIFHRWIQQDVITDHLLLDVADYKHVPKGPGILLVAHEADYGIDLTEGRPGLLYTRKRDLTGSTGEQVTAVLAAALTAASHIEREASLAGSLTFAPDTVQISFLDRLRTPNSPAQFAALRPHVEAVLAPLHPNGQIQITQRYTDPRQPLTFNAAVSGAAPLDRQIVNLARAALAPVPAY